MERRSFLKNSTKLTVLAGLGNRRLSPTIFQNGPGDVAEAPAERYDAAWSDTADPDYKHATPEAVEAWHDRKFGMRIHHGVYSVLGLDASVPLIDSSKVFQDVYSTMYQVFNPTDFNAGEWADLARRAGMKYVTYTTKHCDGFSMFDTKTKVQSIRRVPKLIASKGEVGIGPVEECVIPYSVMDTPYKTDIVAAVVDAFRKQGMGIGLYYNWTDFHDPNFRWEKRNVFYDPHYSKRSNPENWQAMIARIRESLREIATNYGKLDSIEFDQGLPRDAWPDTVNIVKMVRNLQPGALFRDRGIGPYGDISTPEHWVPENPADPRLGDKPWQAIEQIGTRWAYQPNDVYKPKEWIVSTLITTASLGGNFTPGVSPMSNGKFPRETIERLEYAGDWLRVNGEAIYGTRRWDVFKDGENIRFTRTKDGRTVYIISTQWPGQSLTVKSLRVVPGSQIEMLGVKHPLRWQQGKEGLVIDIPGALENNRPCQQAFVFKTEAQAYRKNYD